MSIAVFGNEVASLEAIGFYYLKDNQHIFKPFYLSNIEGYKEFEDTFTKVDEGYFLKSELEDLQKHKEDIISIQKAIKDTNEFIKQEDVCSARTYSEMLNPFLFFINREDIVPKEYKEWLSKIKTTDHYGYSGILKDNLTISGSKLIGDFASDFEMAFKPSESELVLTPKPINNKEELEYTLYLFIGRKYKNKSCYIELNVKLNKYNTTSL